MARCDRVAHIIRQPQLEAGIRIFYARCSPAHFARSFEKSVSRNNSKTSAAEEVVDPSVGRKAPYEGAVFLDRYRLGNLIASGSMGAVYRATQIQLGRTVAIKVLHGGQQRRDDRFAKRFFREASVVAQLSHPNIVTVFDYGQTPDGALFMAMEYVHGRSVAELLAIEGPLSPRRASSIALQIALGLRTAHRHGVIHRDVKPANLILTQGDEEDDLVKILDFGLVKVFGGEIDSTSGFHEEPLTRVGTLVGTPEYTSPEQALGEGVDARSDVYSLGVVLFAMLAGRSPFTGSSIAEVLGHHLRTPVPRLQEVNPECACPPGLEAILRKSLEKNKEHRFASMDDFADALSTARGAPRSDSPARQRARAWSSLETTLHGAHSGSIDVLGAPDTGREEVDATRTEISLARYTRKPHRATRLLLASAVMSLGVSAMWQWWPRENAAAEAPQALPSAQPGSPPGEVATDDVDAIPSPESPKIVPTKIEGPARKHTPPHYKDNPY